MKYSNITIGSDPELFIQDNKGNPVSAIDKIGGTKECPRQIFDDGSSVQEDNVAVEFNTAPAKTKDEFVNNVKKVLGYLNDYVGQQGYKFMPDVAVFFPPEELEHPKAKAFGCDSDYCVWIGGGNRPNQVAAFTDDTFSRLRSCGGHVHVGFAMPDDEMRRELVKAMDVYLGIPSVVLDNDDLRRGLYGKAGCFRYKPYGVEYRTLSNFWIRDSHLVEWVYERTMKAIEFLNRGKKIWDVDAPTIQQIINDRDLREYDYILRKYDAADAF